MLSSLGGVTVTNLHAHPLIACEDLTFSERVVKLRVTFLFIQLTCCITAVGGRCCRWCYAGEKALVKMGNSSHALAKMLAMGHTFNKYLFDE